MIVGGRLGTGFAIVALVIGAAAPAGASPLRTSGPAAAVDTITLISGDRVIAHDGTVRSIRPGTGRESVAFSRFVADGHSYVIPSDATRLVASGRLDRRLFDITTLLEFGYDDARLDTVPLIVTRPAGRAAPRIATPRCPRNCPVSTGPLWR